MPVPMLPFTRYPPRSGLGGEAVKTCTFTSNLRLENRGKLENKNRKRRKENINPKVKI